ncbi:MAG: dienelactone hydrolase family protein [Sphingomonas fennica]
MGETISIAALDGSGGIPAYVAMPKEAPRGAIVVIQEIFGINSGIRAKADEWAGLGYVAIAPDLFWRFAPGVELDPDVPDQLQAAFANVQKFDVDTGMADIETTIREARDRAGARKVGVVGFCLGGRLAYLAATRTDADASVGYYGGGIDQKLGEAAAISNPLMLHFAGDDSHIGPEAVSAIEAALQDKPGFRLFVYPGAGHGFAANSGQRRNEAAATTADDRTRAFIAEHIG